MNYFTHPCQGRPSTGSPVRFTYAGGFNPLAVGLITPPVDRAMLITAAFAQDSTTMTSGSTVQRALWTPSARLDPRPQSGGGAAQSVDDVSLLLKDAALMSANYPPFS